MRLWLSTFQQLPLNRFDVLCACRQHAHLTYALLETVPTVHSRGASWWCSTAVLTQVWCPHVNNEARPLLCLTESPPHTHTPTQPPSCLSMTGLAGGGNRDETRWKESSEEWREGQTSLEARNLPRTYLEAFYTAQKEEGKVANFYNFKGERPIWGAS